MYNIRIGWWDHAEIFEKSSLINNFRKQTDNPATNLTLDELKQKWLKEKERCKLL